MTPDTAAAVTARDRQTRAASTGTNLIARKPGDPLPKMVLDGVLQAQFADGLCRECSLWWHTMPQP